MLPIVESLESLSSLSGHSWLFNANFSWFLWKSFSLRILFQKTRLLLLFYFLVSRVLLSTLRKVSENSHCYFLLFGAKVREWQKFRGKNFEEYHHSNSWDVFFKKKLVKMVLWSICPRRLRGRRQRRRRWRTLKSLALLATFCSIAVIICETKKGSVFDEASLERQFSFRFCCCSSEPSQRRRR